MEKKEKDLGHVKNIKCQLIKPMKMEFNMDSVKQITLIKTQTMKTIKILLLLLVIILSSCMSKPKSVYEVTYVVYYPQHSDTTTVELISNEPWEAKCNRGDNYLWAYGGGYYLSTSAPIKIIHQYKVK